MSAHHTEKITSSQSKTKRILSLVPDAITQEELGGGKFLIYKERGETLAVLLRRFRHEQGIPKEVPITYAGRLDPMAEGVVLLLVGEDRYKKDEYLKLTKTYEIEVLFGIATDTQDALGLCTRQEYRPISKARLEQAIQRLPSISEIAYPAYSSVLVEGIPLFVHTRAGREVPIPKKKVVITEAALLHMRTVPLEMIAREAIDDIGKVEGDFRQISAMKEWRSLIETHHEVQVSLATIRIGASSGTYMRSLAQWIGEELGIPALAYKIKRTKIGDWKI